MTLTMGPRALGSACSTMMRPREAPLRMAALNLAYLVSGVVIVESVFNYPGLAKLMVDAVAYRDIPLVQAVGMVFCATYVGLNLAADLLAILANPRLRHPR